VFLHVDPETLSEDGRPGRSNLEDGTRLPAESARRLACDGSVVKVIRGADGEVLDVGRRTRTVPPALRRALEIRDGGCRWPGCGLRFTDAHHVRHWRDGGRTDQRNLLLLCRFHHRKVHEGGWKVAYNAKDDTAVFFGPRGAVRAHRLGGGPRPKGDSAAHGGDDPVARLMDSNRRRGVHPDGWSASSRYERSSQIPWSVYVRALEVLDDP
jgi:hypothetical protein